LPAAEQIFFQAKRQAGALLESAPTLPEPHGSWVRPLELEWTRRYGV
jgi:putative thiamine transport system substrate-binding protein